MRNCYATSKVQPYFTFTKHQQKLKIKEKWSFSFVIYVKKHLNLKYSKT